MEWGDGGYCEFNFEYVKFEIPLRHPAKMSKRLLDTEFKHCVKL